MMPERTPTPELPTPPDAAQAALDEAIEARQAITDELFDATNVFRDHLAAHDNSSAYRAYARAHVLEQRWYAAVAHVQHLRGRIRMARWHDDHDEEAA
jgi:hypothetical protein